MTGRERVANKALSGDEIKSIIKEDFDRLLSNEGLLSPHIAHGRIAYDITLRLHMDNPFNSESQSGTTSRPIATNIVRDSPQLAAVEALPLASPSPEAVAAGDRISRSIDSPNAERLRMGMPVPVEVKQMDGTITTEQIKYPPNPELGDGNMKLEDATPEARAAFGLPTLTLAAADEVPLTIRLGKCGHSDHNVALSGLCTVCGAEWIDAATPDPPPATPQDWPANPPDKRDAFYGGA